MAACQLVIQIDEPSRPRSGGEPVTGTVVVRADKQTQCKGLVVRCFWSTHGRGNIDTGDVDTQTLFEGNWDANKEYRYPFKLATAIWPPTYYGNYLNVGHYVHAQAKLSWAKDPKAQVDFPVTASEAPQDLKPTQVTKSTNFIVWIIGGIFVVVLLAIFSVFVIFLLPIALLIAGLVWFFKVFLPRQITGPVDLELKTPRTTGGNKVQATMSFIPRRSSTINGIEWTISCVEECSSGSGSSRQTHRHEFLKESLRVSETLALKAGEKQSFDFEFELPANSPPSLKFSDNQVKWDVTGRIDIPSWPDWTKTLPLIVAPINGNNLVSHFVESDSDESSVAPPPRELTPADAAWFSQVVAQIQQTLHDPEKLNLVIQAVRSFSFPLTISIEDEIEAPYWEDQEEFDRLEEFDWWNAYCPQHNIKLSIAWFETPVEVDSGATWSGNATIVGYEAEQHRFVMEAVPWVSA